MIRAVVGIVMLALFAQPAHADLALDKALVAASVQGKVDQVTSLLAQGADPNAVIDPSAAFPATPLVGAVIASSPDEVRALVAKGADPRRNDDIAVILALELQDEPVVTALLAGLGPITSSDPPFVNILVSRPGEGGAAILRDLIKAELTGATPNQNPDLTNFMKAMEAGRYATANNDPALAILRALVARGADLTRLTPSMRDDGDANAVQAASGNGDLLMVAELRRLGAKLPTSWTEDMLRQALLVGAARAGNVNGVKELLAAGASPNGSAPDDEFALPEAVLFGRADVVDALLAAKADPNLRGSHETSALQVAASLDQTDLVKKLLNGGAKPGLVDERYAWPLRAAARNGASASMRLLVAAGALVADVDGRSRTVLHNLNLTDDALFADATDTRALDPQILAGIKTLASLGFDFSRTDQAGRTALSSSISFTFVDRTLLDAFVGAGAKIGPDFLAAAKERHRLEAIDWAVDQGAAGTASDDLVGWVLDENSSDALLATALVKGGAPLPADDYDRASLVQTAARRGANDLLALLVKRGISLDGRSSTTTAIEEAVLGGHPDTVRLLVENGAKPTSPRDTSATVLHDILADDVARARSNQPSLIGDPQENAIAALIDAGLKLDAKNTHRQTVSDIAAQNAATQDRLRASIAAAGGQESDLHRAVRADDLAAVVRLVANGAKMDAKDALGRTPLTLALQLGKIAIVEHLLASGSPFSLAPATPYQVADVDYAADERLAAAFIFRMLTDPVLDVEGNAAWRDPSVSIAAFDGNAAMVPPDLTWTVTCRPCSGEIKLAGTQQKFPALDSFRSGDTRKSFFKLVQSNILPVELHLPSPVGGSGEGVAELEFTVAGALHIPGCTFVFRDHPTCYPNLEVSNPNAPSTFKITTRTGEEALPGAIVAVVQNGSTSNVMPGEHLTIDRSVGPVDILIQPVTAKMFSFSLPIEYGEGPDTKVAADVGIGARASTYARLLKLRAALRDLQQSPAPGTALQAKTLATAIHVVSARTVSVNYVGVLSEALKSRARDIKGLDLQMIALRNTIIAQSQMTPAQLDLLIARVDGLLADPSVGGKDALQLLRAGLVAARQSATDASSAVQILRGSLYSEVDRYVRDYQALILELAQYVPESDLEKVLDSGTVQAIQARVSGLDVVIADGTLNGRGPALRKDFGLPKPVGGGL